MGVLSRAIVMVGLAFVLAWQGPARADVTSDKDAAAQLLKLIADVAKQEKERLTQALGNDQKFVFWRNDEPVVISKQQVDSVIAYLQIEYLLDPKRTTKAAEAVAKLYGISPGLFMPLLENPGDLAADAVEYTLYQYLESEAAAAKPKVEAYIAKLDAFIADTNKEAQAIEQASTWPPGGSGTQTFSPVQAGGMTVDYCLTFATNCGQPVADEFCRQQGFKSAQAFEWKYMRPTRTLGSGEVCDADYCGGITSVTCQ